MDQTYLKSIIEYNPDNGLFRRLYRTSPTANLDWSIGSKRPDGYTFLSIQNKQYLCHRLAWLYIYGAFPKTYLDHINQNKQDNRIVNLRLTNKSLNALNTSLPHEDSSSTYQGVSRTSSGKWMCKLTINGYQRYLGSYNTEEEAYMVYRKEKELYIG